jgi:diguanylate cyclase (GGDEF)-like protein
VVATIFAQVQASLTVEDRLRYQAEHDDLTALPNRRTLLAHLDYRLVEGRAGPVPLLLFNLNRLKAINDHLGHDAGDQFIGDFATRTTEAMAGQGLIARLGGDKFVVVPASPMDVDTARKLAERLSAQLTDHVTIGDEVLNRAVSVGVATGVPRKDSSLDLLRRADEALLSTKGTGGESIGVFSAEMLTRSELRNDIELHLLDGIETDAYTVVYLPEFDIVTGKVSRSRLVRWQHPTRGLLFPDEFVPAAESINLAGDLGNWIMHAACAHLAEWRAHGVGLDTMIRINVSPAQLVAHDLVNTIQRALEKFGLDARR